MNSIALTLLAQLPETAQAPGSPAPQDGAFRDLLSGARRKEPPAQAKLRTEAGRAPAQQPAGAKPDEAERPVAEAAGEMPGAAKTQGAPEAESESRELPEAEQPAKDMAKRAAESGAAAQAVPAAPEASVQAAPENGAAAIAPVAVLPGAQDARAPNPSGTAAQERETTTHLPEAAPARPERESRQQAADMPAKPQIAGEPGSRPLLAVQQEQPAAEEKPHQDRPVRPAIAQTAQQEKFDRMVALATRQLQSAEVPQEQAEAETEDAAFPAQPQGLAPEAQKRPAEGEKIPEPKAAPKPAKRAGDTEESLPAAPVSERPRAEVRAVKSAEPPVRPFELPAPAEQVRAELIENLEKDKMEFRMQLQPEELGKVSVKLVLEGGRLAVEIAAASRKAAEALHRQTDSLAASLRTSGVEVESIQVVAEAQTASGHMQNAFDLGAFQSGQSETGQQRSGSAAHMAKGDPLPAETPEDARRPRQLLDYAV